MYKKMAVYDICERVIALFKAIGYTLLALYVYLDLFANNVVNITMTTEENKLILEDLFTDRIIYWTISVAILEVIANLLAGLKPNTLK